MEQYIDKQIPELAYGGNLKTLVRRVYATQCGAERDHLQLGILLEEETALQACMYSSDLWLNAKKTLVALYRHGQQT